MKTALITGAGSGIGRATAIALGNSGYALALVGRRREPLEETAELTGAPETLVLTGDVSKADEAAAVVQAAAEGLGEGDGLSVLVNNAGQGEVVPIASMTPAVWDRLLAANASSAAYCTMAAWASLLKERGTIVNIASIAVYDPFAGFMAYGAAKAAMAHLTVSCVKEGEAGGVTAYCICPGAVETAMLRASFDESVIPPADTMAAEEVAAVVLACVRGERPGDNGRTIPLLPRSQRDSWASWRLSNPSGWLGMQG